MSRLPVGTWIKKRDMRLSQPSWDQYLYGQIQVYITKHSEIADALLYAPTTQELFVRRCNVSQCIPFTPTEEEVAQYMLARMKA